MLFQVWSPDDGDETSARIICCIGPELAAELFVNNFHSDFDYANHVRVTVRDDDGQETEWDVEARSEIHFYAKERDR